MSDEVSTKELFNLRFKITQIGLCSVVATEGQMREFVEYVCGNTAGLIQCGLIKIDGAVTQLESSTSKKPCSTCYGVGCIPFQISKTEIVKVICNTCRGD